MALRPPLRGTEPVTPPFRLRAITLAVIAFGVGTLCLLSVINSRRLPPPRPAPSAEHRWPPGFVELDDAAPLPRPAVSASASASSSAAP